MAYKRKGIAVGVVMVWVAFSLSFTHSTSSYSPKTIRQYAIILQREVDSLDQQATAFMFGKTTKEALRQQVTQTRLAFKTIEFYLAFQYPEYVKSHLNGAPLLGIEKEDSKANISLPEGLQVLDEMVYADHPESEKTKIASLGKKLAMHYESLNKSLQKQPMLNQLPVEAMRLELVRILSLGITGFDTPGSLNALPEAKAALQGMYDQLLLKQENYPEKQVEQSKVLFEMAIAKLSQKVSFEDFNRLHFLTTYIDPLYRYLGKMTVEKDSELIYTSAWNEASESIFSSNFLNPYFFTNLKKEEDSPALRALGKQLFYDTDLSGNEQLSCASCHNPNKAFTDGKAKSMSSIQGKTVLRNAPTLLNAVYADRYFYDLRAFTLEQQAEHVIFNSAEFNTAYSAILKKLNSSEAYSKSFQKVFGSNEITRDKFSKALASYVLSLQSFNSPFDQYVRGERQIISEEVKDGFNLFMGKANCATCHFVPTFSGLVPPLYAENESEILGVLKTPNQGKPQLDTDEGRFESPIESEKAWIYEKSFKTNTVRNSALTAPYFHNGAYNTLAEVIDFYNDGGGEGVGLHVKNQTLPADKLHLTEHEKEALIAFLKSLTDTSAVTKSTHLMPLN